MVSTSIQFRGTVVPEREGADKWCRAQGCSVKYSGEEAGGAIREVSSGPGYPVWSW